MKVLMVGGAGFIGSHVSLFFHDLGHEVTIMSRSAPSNASRLGGLPFVRADYVSEDCGDGRLEGYDWLVFCAGNDLGNFPRDGSVVAGGLFREGQHRGAAPLFRGGEARRRRPRGLHGQLLFVRRAAKHRDHPLRALAPLSDEAIRALSLARLQRLQLRLAVDRRLHPGAGQSRTGSGWPMARSAAPTSPNSCRPAAATS